MLNKLLAPILTRIPENNRIERIWKLAQVDFKKRYYNDKLGLLWALLNPALKIAIYYFVFKYVLNNQQENFAIFLFSGLLIWMAFIESAGKGLNIIQSKRYLIQNIQFEKIDLFLSSTLGVYLGFLFNLGAYVLALLASGISIKWTIIFLPIILLNVFIVCLGASMILATIKIYLKDITHLWAIIVLGGFWSSGIFFPGEQIIKVFPPILYLNPFIGIIDNMRLITMYGEMPNFVTLLINFCTALVVFLIGLIVFDRYSHKAIELM